MTKFTLQMMKNVLTVKSDRQTDGRKKSMSLLYPLTLVIMPGYNFMIKFYDHSVSLHPLSIIQ